MAKREGNGLGATVIVVMAVMLACGVALIVDLAMRPLGALDVPKGYHAVHVRLTDYAISAPTRLVAGNYEFVVTNRGTVSHELVMWATKDRAAALPLRKDGSVDEESDALEGVLDSGSSLAPGESRILYADLTAPGHYALVCNLPDHYHLGMHLDLTAN
jgi:uncharacterized cupredoxin-like copper-binding protein